MSTEPVVIPEDAEIHFETSFLEVSLMVPVTGEDGFIDADEAEQAAVVILERALGSADECFLYEVSSKANEEGESMPCIIAKIPSGFVQKGIILEVIKDLIAGIEEFDSAPMSLRISIDGAMILPWFNTDTEYGSAQILSIIENELLS